MNVSTKKEAFKLLDYPKWKRVGEIDFIEIEALEKNGSTSIKGLKQWQNQGVKVYKITSEDKDLDDVLYTPLKECLFEIDSVQFGSNDKLVLQSETEFNLGHVVIVPDHVQISEPLEIHYSIETKTIDQTVIHMGKGATATLVVVYKGEKGNYHNGLIKIYASEGSTLHLSEVQMLNNETIHIQNTVSYLEKEATVNLTTIDFGGSIVVTDYSSHLVGNQSISLVNSAYIGDGDRKLDIGYNTYHKGMRSESLVNCKGALLDSSRKTFRGNLRFLHGAKRSKGRESEYVLLLDEHVQSDAIPALLCDEDDVSGEHAASAGQVNPQQLFYLMSRGFSVNEAKKLIIHGSFSQVINYLPTKDLILEVEEELERRLVHAK